MPLVATIVDLCRGHDRCSPRPFSTASDNVHVEGFRVTREADALQNHGCSKHAQHDAEVTRGYPSVRVNGSPIAYVGADVSCPSGVVDTGRPSVMVGEGARIAWTG